VTNRNNKTPKTYFLKILLPCITALVIIALAADWLVGSVIIPNAETSGAGKIYRLYHSKEKLIPILGSSRARCSYNPYFMKLKSYNFGLDGVSLIGTISLARIHCKRNPEVPVIINLDYAFWKTIGDVVSFVPYTNDTIIKNALVEANACQPHYSIPGIKYFDFYPNYFRHSFKSLFPTFDSLYNGYDYEMNKPVPSFKELNEAIELRRKNPLVFKTKPKQIALLKKLFLDYPDTKFYFIKAPYHSSFVKDASDLQGFDKYINFLKGFNNVSVIKDVPNNYSDSCFADNIHVNRLGAKRFGTWLSSRLSQYPDLKPYIVE